jgi:hypothetical protein
MAYLQTHFWRDGTEEQYQLLPALPVDGGFAGAPEERVAEVAHLETV